MFKYSLVAVAMIFIAVACNKKEEAAVEAAPAEQTEVAAPAAEVAPTEAAPVDAAAPTEAPAEAPAQ
jgi:hypothetical protein